MEPGVERVLGYTEPEWLGQHVSIIFSGDDREAHVVDNEMRTAAEQGRCVDLRWHVRKDGTRVYMTGVLRALRDGRGALIGYSKIFLDDTPRKQLEDALTRSNEDLQQFALVASHDLQEPLRTLSGFARLLNQRYAGQLDDEAHKNLAFVLDATERMSRLITDLLAYSQLAREGSRATSVHLDDDLESAISLLRSTVQEADAVITHDALPNVELDRDQMVRVFQNLLGNALKFRKPSEPPVIPVSSERVRDDWMIRITDNGIGFPPDQAQAIFAPFNSTPEASSDEADQ